MRGSRIAWAAVATAVVGGCLAIGVVGLRPRPAAPPQPAELSTTTVERADLVETLTIDGEIGYGPPSPLHTGLSGTVTGLPTAGATIGRDQRLYAVDSRAVVLFLGALPAWRDLAPGVEGRDVRQLEANLSALGYGGFTVDNRYTSATARAVRSWQSDHGLVRTGEIELGRVVFWPTAVRIGNVEAVAGQQIAAGAVVLQHTSTSRNVYADIEVELAGHARNGASVQVAAPGRPVVPGRISAIGTTIEQPSASEGEQQTDAQEEPTIELTITIADQGAMGSITGAPVEVRLVGERRQDVLTVPVAALLALREGGHGLEVIEGDRREIVAVRTGLFAAGRVEVSGGGLQEGATVGMAAS